MFQIPKNCWTGLLSVDRFDRPMCTNVRSKGRSTARLTDRDSLLSVNGTDRPGGRRQGHLPVYGQPAGRPLFPTVKNLTVGGRPTAGRPAELASNGHILGAYKLGLPWTVFYKI